MYLDDIYFMNSDLKILILSYYKALNPKGHKYIFLEDNDLNYNTVICEMEDV